MTSSNKQKGEVIAFISAPGVGTSFLTKQMACRHSSPGFFEGEEGIFTPSVIDVLNSEVDTTDRWKWITNRTKVMLERAHAIAEIGITSYVDGDVLLVEAWLDSEQGDQSPTYLKKWLQTNRHLMANKVLVLTANDQKMEENRISRGRVSEQNEFIAQRAARIGHACAKLSGTYAHAQILDRSELDFTETKTLNMIDDLLKKINAHV